MNKGIYNKYMQKILKYDVKGSGPPILFLHGMLGSGLYWSDIIEQLKDDYQVITVDLLGFGDSPKPQNLEYTTEDHLAYIVATLDAIGVPKPMTVVGHSMGAILALDLAKNYPKYVKNLVLISLPIYQNPTEARAAIIGSKIVPKLMYYGPTARITCAVMCRFRPLAQFLAPHFLKNVPSQVAIDATKHTWYSYSRSMSQVIERQNVLTTATGLTIPILLVYGTDDKIASLKNTEVLKRSSRELKIVKIEGTHQVPIEQPARIAQLITGTILG
jgi:pimeloyl-ACP methyl ester carboxylesterase